MIVSLKIINKQKKKYANNNINQTIKIKVYRIVKLKYFNLLNSFLLLKLPN